VAFVQNGRSVVVSIVGAMLALFLEYLLFKISIPIVMTVFKLFGENQSDILLPSILCSAFCGYMAFGGIVRLLKKTDSNLSFRIYIILFLVLTIIDCMIMAHVYRNAGDVFADTAFRNASEVVIYIALVNAAGIFGAFFSRDKFIF